MKIKFLFLSFLFFIGDIQSAIVNNKTDYHLLATVIRKYDKDAKNPFSIMHLVKTNLQQLQWDRFLHLHTMKFTDLLHGFTILLPKEITLLQPEKYYFGDQQRISFPGKDIEAHIGKYFLNIIVLQKEDVSYLERFMKNLIRYDDTDQYKIWDEIRGLAKELETPLGKLFQQPGLSIPLDDYKYEDIMDPTMEFVIEPESIKPLEFIRTQTESKELKAIISGLEKAEQDIDKYLITPFIINKLSYKVIMPNRERCVIM